MLAPSRKRRLGITLGTMFDRLVTYEHEAEDRNDEEAVDQLRSARVAVGIAQFYLQETGEVVTI